MKVSSGAGSKRWCRWIEADFGSGLNGDESQRIHEAEVVLWESDERFG